MADNTQLPPRPEVWPAGGAFSVSMMVAAIAIDWMDAAESALSTAEARIAELEAENAALKAQLEGKTYEEGLKDAAYQILAVEDHFGSKGAAACHAAYNSVLALLRRQGER